jgi:hypothetical protein
VWGALDPVTQWLLALAVGERPLALAQGVVHQVVQGLAPGCVPRCLTDGCTEDPTARLAPDGQWVQPPRRQDTGPAPKPRWLPRPQRGYAQVSKPVRRRRLVAVTHRVGFGTLEAVQQVLAPCGWPIHTAFVERITLTIRQPGAAGGRRVSTRGKGEDGVRQQLALYHADSNLI